MTVHPFPPRHTIANAAIRPVRPLTVERVRDWCEGREPFLFPLVPEPEPPPVAPRVRVVEAPLHWSVPLGWFCAGGLVGFIVGMIR